jgi:hypothetical protein
MIVSCQLRTTMAMKADTTVTEFCTIVVAVSVRTVRTPLTSFASRDWIAPVLVAVKKASSIFCRCAKRSPRRSAIAEFPMVLVSRFCPMPISAVAIGTTHSPATSQPSRWKSGGPPSVGKSAESKTALVRNGDRMPSSAETTTASPTRSILLRYGASIRAIRRSVVGEPSSTAGSATTLACVMP